MNTLQPELSKIRLVIVQYAGDYAEVFERLAKGGSETYYAQKYSVDAVTEMAKRAESVTVICCLSPEFNEKVLDNRVRTIACGFSHKINSQKLEIASLFKQMELIKGLVQDNVTMLKSEERLFSFGESSLFIINTRENNLVSAQLSKIALENRFYISNSELFKIMANPD